MKTLKIRRNKWIQLTLLLVIIAIASAVACGAAPPGNRHGKGKHDGTPLSPTTYNPQVSLAPLIKKVSPAVVNIRTTVKVRRNSNFMGPDIFEWFFGPRGRGRSPFPSPDSAQKQRSMGSGFIVDKTGLVVTNHHVVVNADEIEIQLSDDRTFKADLVGSDERTDVALLRLRGGKNLPTVSFGNSEKLEVGDHVVAIGNPFGLDHTVTSGIVSAKARRIGAGPYDDFIQTDASINPGNSGGPLFDLSGQVIGINTAIAPQGQGIGFAIPSKMAQSVIASLTNNGKVVRGWLGIAFQPVDDTLAQAFKVKTKDGAMVANVTPGSPAEKGGLRNGDIIIEVAGKKLDEASDLPTLVASLSPGKVAGFKVLRNGKSKTLKVKIGEMPDSTDGRPALKSREKGKTALGFHVESLDDRNKKMLGIKDIEGVVVTQVDPGSAANEGISSGDVIVEVNRQKVRNLKEFNEKTKNLHSSDDMLLLVYRNGGWRYVVIRL